MIAPAQAEMQKRRNRPGLRFSAEAHQILESQCLSRIAVNTAPRAKPKKPRESDLCLTHDTTTHRKFKVKPFRSP